MNSRKQKILRISGGESEEDLFLSKLRDKNVVVLCHGVFDIVHPGHIEHFLQAKKRGNLLIVSVTSDRFVNKGPNRPIFDVNTRVKFLSSLEVVDFVVVADSESAVPIIEKIKPHFYVKGGDYRQLEADATGKIIQEKIAVESNGGCLEFTGGFSSSSSTLINMSGEFVNSKLRDWVEGFKDKCDFELFSFWLDKVINLKPLVLGELIIDRYSYCQALSKSSKDPILAFEKLDTKSYLGGIGAIFDNLSKWSNPIGIFVKGGIKDEIDELTYSLVEKDVDIRWIIEERRKNIVKHRFVDSGSNVKLFEYYDYDPSEIKNFTVSEVIRHIKNHDPTHGPIVIADYGHGFFTKEIIEALMVSNFFLGVNTQANAGNRGYNTISKYSRGDFIALNGGELELEYRKKNLDFLQVVPEIIQIHKSRNAIVTLGSEGLIAFSSSGAFTQVPALASKVVDKVGAGDSVLAIASLLSFVGAPIEVIALAASIVAATEVSYLGHQNNMSLLGIKRSAKGILA
jgi:rfaE bifunctional protein nucleotidyltransferase chain/domain